MIVLIVSFMGWEKCMQKKFILFSYLFYLLFYYYLLFIFIYFYLFLFMFFVAE